MNFGTSGRKQKGIWVAMFLCDCIFQVR